jgi:hypothetical protein
MPERIRSGDGQVKREEAGSMGTGFSAESSY